MNFLNHSGLEGKHAFLGASKFQWITYDEEKLVRVWANEQAKKRGTELHDLAKRLIDNGIQLPDKEYTFNMYVNDCIGYHMTAEQILYYSSNCFGTADAISFKKNKLRIFDLKTGQTPAHMDQLMVYNALFCLEYKIKPADIETELRIYQNNAIDIYNPSMEDIVPIMDKIINFDNLINELKLEG